MWSSEESVTWHVTFWVNGAVTVNIPFFCDVVCSHRFGRTDASETTVHYLPPRCHFLLEATKVAVRVFNLVSHPDRFILD